MTTQHTGHVLVTKDRFGIVGDLLLDFNDLEVPTEGSLIEAELGRFTQNTGERRYHVIDWHPLGASMTTPPPLAIKGEGGPASKAPRVVA